MGKLLVIEGMVSKPFADQVVSALKTVDGVKKVTPSVKDSAVLVDCAPYVSDHDLLAAAVACGFNAEIKMDYSLQKAIAEAGARIEGYKPKF